MLLLLLACASPTTGERYAAATAAPDFEAGWTACGGIEDADLRADCRQNVAVRFAKFDHCDQLPEGVWRQECWFAAAEHLARQKDRVGAIEVCAKTGFTRNCEAHVLDGLAMDVHTLPVTEAAAALAPLVPSLDIGHVAHEFWYSYFRIRIERGLPIDPAGCDPELCAGGARRAIQRVVEADRRPDPERPIPDYPWATSEWAKQVVETAWTRPTERPPRRPRPVPPPVESGHDPE